VVVLEAIYRRREQGELPEPASRTGTGEVGKAIVASTLTTIIVFFPVVYLEGITSQLFKDQALAVGFALLASLLVAVTVIPALTAGIRKARVGKDITSRMKERYGAFMRRMLGRRKPVLGGVLALTLLAFAGATLIPMQLLPSTPVEQLEISFSAPEGTSMDQLVRLSGIATELADTSGAQWVSARIGVRADEGVDALLTAMYDSPDAASAALPRIRNGWNRVFSFPVMVEKRQSLLGQILGGGSGFTVYMEGENLDIDRQAAQALSACTEAQVPGVESADVQYLPGKPEIMLTLDTELLSLLGIDASDVADYLESLTRGYPATTFYRQDERVDVMLLAGEGEGIPIREVLSRSLPTALGLVSLDRLIEPVRRQTPGYIEHYQGNRAVALQIQSEGSNLAGLAETISGIADSLLSGAPVRLRTGSEIEEMERTTSGLLLAGLLAVGLVYVLLAVQFESFREPFVIMFTVPLGVIGVVAGLILFGQSWNALSGIGLVILCGIVVNDGILLVERIGQLRREGSAMEEAIIQAGRDRFRPVIMTTVTTVLGLLPMATGLGVGASLRQPLAIAVISGILVATALTLVVVPLLYRMLARRDGTVAGQ